MTGIKLKMIN